MNDRSVMEIVGWPMCPNDAHSDIKNIAKFVLTKNGGEGIVRELLDMISK